MTSLTQVYGKIIGLYQIFGSLIGFYYLIILIADGNSGDSIFRIVLYVPLIVFSILAGYDAFKYNSFRWTLYNLLLQCVQFKLYGFAFYYISGLYVGVGVLFPNDVYFDFSLLESVFFFQFNSPGGQDVFGFNLISILFVIVTLHFMKKLDLKKA